MDVMVEKEREVAVESRGEVDQKGREGKDGSGSPDDTSMGRDRCIGYDESTETEAKAIKNQNIVNVGQICIVVSIRSRRHESDRPYQ